MTEPWLDSLSEDWNSEPRHSSPSPSSIAGKDRHGSQLPSPSQSRIPHLAHSMRGNSTGSSFLKPRSTKGIAKASVRVLSERSASSLNLPPSSPHDASQKRRSSTLPRRVSSAFSESQSSVQHHSLSSKPTAEEIPVWKRRLIEGENPVSDGFDLFSPSKLEGMFAEPSSKKVDAGSQSSFVEGESKPWSALKYSQLPSSNEQFSSYRASRSRAPVMEALHEVNEEEDGIDEDRDDYQDLAKDDAAIDWAQEDGNQDMSAISSDLVREGSIRGLVKRRVSHLESVPRAVSRAIGGSRTASGTSRDPRWRTFSGQEEMRNEYISPVTASAQNTIRERAMQGSVDLDPVILRERLLSADVKPDCRPSSRSSDHEVSYIGHGRRDENSSPDGLVPELTSVSLPEDLSMGTQDFEQNGRFINTRRGGNSSETSFWRRKLSSMANSSRLDDSEKQAGSRFRSSPPPYETTKDDLLDQSKFTASLPESYHDTSIIHHSPSPVRPPSGGSPLKLFGNRDTYTNNKLLRVLSQYEQDRSHVSEATAQSDPLTTQQEAGLRMSQFGRGELDSFHFEQEVTRPRTAPFPTVDDSEKIFTKFANLSLNDQPATEQRAASKSYPPAGTDYEEKQKRVTSSPAKDRSPKRRRTLLKDEIFVDGVSIEIKLDQVPDSAGAAGKKRKDARPGEQGAQADAETLASRSILQPRPGSRKSSGAGLTRSASQGSVKTMIMPPGELASALAAELATFAQGASAAKQDSRKPSLATKDYMEEANKVMEFIRARGKPKSHLPGIVEPSELDPDSILDVDLDDDSTKESFSRPPSRERYSKPWEDRRVAKHDPKVASQLKKYQEPDDLDLLASTSAIGTFKLVDNRAADEAAQIPVPGGDQESSPPNMRILNSDDSVRHPRRTSVVGVERSIDQSLPSSTKRTYTTGSSNSSGHKGVISSGTVSIPENVGTMTFDREKQVWVKQRLALQQASRREAEHTPRSNRDLTLEDDPFEDIPDLSVDEFQEATMRKEPQAASRPSTAETIQHGQIAGDFENEDAMYDSEDEHSAAQSSQTSPSISEVDRDDLHDDKKASHSPPEVRDPVAVQEARHEERLYDGVPSEPPKLASAAGKQARVVTIAFSSPIASAIPCKELESMSADELDDEHFLPPEDSDYEDYIPTPQPTPVQKDRQTMIDDGGPEHARTRSSADYVVSQIDEEDDHLVGHEGNSLVHIRDTAESTPRTEAQRTVSRPPSAYKGTSILCLTPLSEFTMHQAERAKHPEDSFVAARPHPKALLQAHGTLALSKDEMIKAITDATLSEPFWEQLRRLDLRNKRLTNLDGMDEYCPAVEELKLDNNQISQLSGFPSSLRRLDISKNKLNDFTSWSHLGNLQYVDVSDNALECLEGFSSLIHLRKLTACKNQLRDIEGVLDLDGLLSINLSGNQLTSIDFEGVDLPRLEELDLSNNQLTSVRNLQCLPRLRRLSLNGNKLKEVCVPSALKNLKVLSMSHNELESIDLNQFPAIEALDIDDNCIRVVGGLSSAERLRRLSIREQRHSPDIVNVILSTPNECSEIMLSSNGLTGGHISLPRYPHYSLRHLELAGCGLKSLPEMFGDYHPNLRTLNLNFNAVQELVSLLGCIKLQHLSLAGNRIKRLRRTCVTLSRLPALQKLDIRDNPLTIGFYSPHDAKMDCPEQYGLPARSSELDEKWVERLDETTALRRRTIELLLAERCKHLTDFDGENFDAQRVLTPDTAWTKLMARGVLMKAIEAPPPTQDMGVKLAKTVNDKPEEGKTNVSGGEDHDLPVA